MPHPSVRNLDFSDIDFRFGPERKICNNTYAGIERTNEPGEEWSGRAYIRLHATIIVKRVGRDTYELRSGGYHTVTTKQRINALLGPAVRVWAKNFEWFVTDLDGTRPFKEGVIVRAYA